VPSGAPEQIVRLYRNSREDTLITGAAIPNTTFEQLVTVDALAGDRFLLSIAPMAMGATDVAVQLFANPTGAVFPAKCQVAYSFSSAATATTVADQCGTNTLTSWDFTTSPPDPVVLGPGPFPEMGMAIDLVPDKYYEATSTLNRTGDTTTQMWVKIDVMPPSTNGAWVFSDQDLDVGGGLGVVIYEPTAPMLQFGTCTTPSPPGPLAFAEVATSYPMETAWHFIRIVQQGMVVSACIDGTKRAMYDLPVGKMTSTYAPRLGRNVVWTPAGAFVDGHIDDVRVFSGALPCE